MKRILLLSACLLGFLSASFAQNKHLTFMGIPIDGDPQSFYQQLQTKGFSSWESIFGETDLTDGDMLVGNFAGYEDVIVQVYSSNDTVYAIDATFYTAIFFNDAMIDIYKDLKSMLAEKYGRPSECKEDEYEPYFHTSYALSNGTIDLCLKESLSKVRINMYFLSLTYTDKQNGKIARNNAINDL